MSHRFRKPAGATYAGRQSWYLAGTGLAARPQGTPASGGDGCQRIAPLLRRCQAARRRTWCPGSTSVVGHSIPLAADVPKRRCCGPSASKRGLPGLNQPPIKYGLFRIRDPKDTSRDLPVLQLGVLNQIVDGLRSSEPNSGDYVDPPAGSNFLRRLPFSLPSNPLGFKSLEASDNDLYPAV